MRKVLLLINSLSENPTGDELDVLVQAEAVEKALDELGHHHLRATCDLNLDIIRSVIEKESPDLVFNLVETLGGKGSLIHIPASLMEAVSVKYTGSPSYSLLVTTDKVRTKKILSEHRIPTPDWILPGDARCPDPDRRYMIKPIWEDGSAGITDESVVEGDSYDFQHSSGRTGQEGQFFEEYIEGREFNITMLAGPGGPQVMPAAEMLYVDYPEGKPRILNYASKWEPDSFEYTRTIRSFDLQSADRELVAQMSKISLNCWDLFEMRGYARVDFRVDQLNRPYVLEVNANPCISPDAGFVAACAEGGINYTSMIDRILGDI